MGKRLMQNHLYKALENHKHVVSYYQREVAQKEDKRDWRTYEQRVARRMKMAAQEIEPVVKEAASLIQAVKTGPGRPEKISVEQKVLILLLKDIFQLSNRKMTNMLDMFTVMTGVDISYKTVERCYSDELARMVIHNMFMILVKRKGIKEADTSGDGTGYSLTVTKHYRNKREKELRKLKDGEKSKKTEKKAKKGRRLFVYAFALMDLDTRMYIGYGTSLSSEKEAFRKARDMAQAIGIAINSARLDKYYSHQSITKEFGKETVLYLIPKSNATIRGSPEWKRIIRNFITDPVGHLVEYLQRNNSESGFSEDKKLCGWKVWQRRIERIDTSLLCKGVWHNLMWLG
jgi:transposase